MGKYISAVFVITLFVCSSCVATESSEEIAAKDKNVEGHSWSVDKLHPLETREDFEDYILRIRFGNKKERMMTFVAFQLRIDSCLKFILEHLEDPEIFKGAEFPIVSNKGLKLTDVTIPAKKYTVGAALEMLLISYFYKDPARKTFHPTKRTGAMTAWKQWYNARAGLFRWNSWGLYSTK